MTSGISDEKPETKHLSINTAYVLLVRQNNPPKGNSELNCIMKVFKINDIT
jgi:hypothetical protein